MSRTAGTLRVLGHAARALAGSGLLGQVRPRMCRNHRGFLLATLAASRLGADLVYLNTDFSASQLGAIFERNRPDLVIADEEFTR
jgi:acyl-CoA synthetase (AMP-forming)/AMP-acid ligase II